MKQAPADDTGPIRLTVEDAVKRLEALPGSPETDRPESQPAKKKAETPPPERDGAEDEERESSEPDDAEHDAESDEEAQSEDGDESPDEPQGEEQPAEKTPEQKPVDAKLTLTLDGEEKQLSRAELEEFIQKGTLRQADYTRKTQEVAAQRNEYASKIAQLDAALTEMTPAEPDWAALAQSDPEGYLAQRAQWDHHQKQRAAVRAELDRVNHELQTEQMETMRQRLQTEHTKLLAAVPEWADDAVRQKDLGELAKFATEVRGFTQQELAGVTDHRLMLMLRDLHRAHLAQQEKPKAVEEVRKEVEAVKSRTPGPAVNPKHRAMSEETKAHLRLRKTGSVDDAVRLLELRANR